MKKIIGLLTGLMLGVTSLAREQVDFKVDLPNSWKVASYSADENLWVYESNDGNHRLIVSILYYSKDPDHNQQGEFLDEFIKTRQEQTSKITPDVKFSEIVTDEYESAWVVKYSETSVNGRLATSKCISSRIGIASFYLESFSSSDLHEEVGGKILPTTRFAS